MIVRTDIRPGDLGRITLMHGRVYAREFGWDARFEGYVARTLADFIDAYDPVRDRLWLADADDVLVGSVAIVHAPGDVAQLRWFLVDPVARGRGLGRRLLDDTVDFCRAVGYGRVFLLTVPDLEVAAGLYREAGFVLAGEEPEELWGSRVVVQRYELEL